ncbi:MAG: hypothetical protein CVV50_05705, partial [Spirochaetae bacterium HGW-Spirochaetae-6]
SPPDENLESSQTYQVKLSTFEGPLDLLLFLIRKKELNIEEVSISIITADYLAYVESLTDIGHTAIAEFLTMACTLLYIKSHSLLPLAGDMQLDDELEDPRKALVYQLIEYEKLKKMHSFLENKKNSTLLEKKPNSFLSELKSQVNFIEINFRELLDNYLKFFNIKKLGMILDKVKKALVSVEEKILWLSKLLKEKIKISFFHITKDFKASETIVTFLASLEMAKQRKVLLFQEELFGDITLEQGKGAENGAEEKIA